MLSVMLSGIFNALLC